MKLISKVKSYKKQFFGLLVTLVIFSYASNLTSFIPEVKSSTVLFSEDFESGNLNNWTTINGNWSIVNNAGTNWVYASASTIADYEIQAGDFTWDNYQITFDIKPLTGTNRNVFFRVNPTRTSILPEHDLPVSYSLNMETGRIILKEWYLGSQSKLADFNIATPNNIKTTIRISVYDNNIKIYHNNLTIPVIDYTDNDSPLLTGRIALATITGTKGSELMYDNIEVTTIDTGTPIPTPTAIPTASPTPSPSPSPTPTPTPSPSPTPAFISLDVPDIKQFVGGWENDLYDHTSSTISVLGCALTSATMILQYHGFDWVTPDILNDWLNGKEDGYLRNGLVNWLAVSRFSNPRLEYLRLSPTSENIMSELENDRPSIIKVPGHFVVSKGETETSFEINDPGYSDRNILSVYPDLITLNTFTPSETDLSYMMFVADEDVVMQLFDELGNLISTQNFVDSPIIHEGTSTESGEPLSVLLFPKPSNGNYTLSLSGGSGSYQLDTYLYDEEGNVVKQNFSGILFGSEKDVYPVFYNSETKVETTYEQILSDLNNAYKNRLIRHRGVYKSLKRQVQISQRYYNMGRKYIAKRILYSVKRQIRWYTPWFINSEVSSILTSNLSLLISSL